MKIKTIIQLKFLILIRACSKISLSDFYKMIDSTPKNALLTLKAK